VSTNPDTALAVERALTGEEQAAFLARFTSLNPRWKGSTVADILAELDNADAHLDLIEPVYQSHGPEVPEPGLLAMAMYAAIYSTTDTAPDLGSVEVRASVFAHARDVIDRVRRGDPVAATQQAIEDGLDMLDASIRRARARRGFRRFHLSRSEDVSGTSGTGIVAEGVVYSTGKVVLNWTTRYASVAVYDSMAEMERIHGHDGRTTVEWLDEAGQNG
jgi:hypothetical protein